MREVQQRYAACRPGPNWTEARRDDGSEGHKRVEKGRPSLLPSKITNRCRCNAAQRSVPAGLVAGQFVKQGGSDVPPGFALHRKGRLQKLGECRAQVLVILI